MKTVVKLTVVGISFLLFSCSSESVTDGTLDAQQELNAVAAKGKKFRPIKAKLFNFPDPDQVNFLLCAPEVPLTRNVIGGNVSHLGKLQEGSAFDEVANVPISGSFGVPTVCNITPEGTLETEFDVYYVAANGDRFVTKEYVTIIFTAADLSTGTFTNTLDGAGDPIPIVIVDGTGRFSDASGELFFKNAVFGPEGTTWELEGEIKY